MRKSLLGIITLMPLFTSAQKPAVFEKEITAIQSKIIEWRRHLHQYPELSNREYKTAAYVAAHLKSLGLEVKTGIAKTGVVAILKGGKPGPVMALRADMDALPLTERTNIPFASKETALYGGKTVGVMHACGHDAHVAILMATAEVLSKIKADVPGTIVFIFQPAEEGAPEGEEGGAALMVKEGVLDNPKADVVFGLHIQSTVPAGDIEYKEGAFMASADLFRIKVKGKGSHGSQPWLGVDPVVTASEIIQSLQTIVSRESDITKAPAVITVGAINGGVRFNIIPEEVEMLGTVRTLDKAMRQTVLEKIRFKAETIAKANGATAEVVIENKTLVTYNDPELTKRMIASLEKAAGKEHVRPRAWVTGAEDFSFYGEKAPSLFLYFGGMPEGMKAENAAPHHTPDFYIDDSKLYVGVKAFCQLVFDYAAQRK